MDYDHWLTTQPETEELTPEQEAAAEKEEQRERSDYLAWCGAYDDQHADELYAFAHARHDPEDREDPPF